jgi:rhamnogalacturonan endolyase
MLKKFSENIAFQEGKKPSLVERFKLSNWKSDVWRIHGNRLSIEKDRIAEIERRKAQVRDVYGEPHSWIKIQNAPWIALSTGSRDWVDYIAKVQLIPTGGGRCGMAFRWLDARHYYAFLLENGNRIALYRREHDESQLLASADFPHSGSEAYVLVASAKGQQIACSVEGGPEISVEDTEYPSGGVALLAESPATYDSLQVRGKRRAKAPRKADSSLVPREEARLRLPRVRSYRNSVYRFVPIDNEPHLLLYSRDENALHCVDRKGNSRYRIGPWERSVGSGGDIPVQVFDLDGDGEEELVIVADYRIVVYSAKTGAKLASIATPPSNPYGEARDAKDSQVAGDALCPVRISPEGPCCFYIKDRYWNIWLYDDRLNVLWTQARNTGHFPLPVDIDGDGRDEILCGHALLDMSGEVRWELDLDDHFDSIGYFDLTGSRKPSFYVSAGEEGLLQIDPASGLILRQRKWGHIQGSAVGRFSPDREDYQLLVHTLWREPGIRYLVDSNLNELARWEGEFGSQWPLPWGDRDLYLCGPNILDPLCGDLISSLPGGDRICQTWVLDWPGLGPSRIAAVSDGEVVFYGPSGREVSRTTPLRGFYSGYLPRGRVSN